MIITEAALSRVDQHWAVKAIGDDRLARALEVGAARAMRSSAGHQTTIIFDDAAAADNDLIERAAMAYEIAAIEGLNAVLHPSSDEVCVQLRQVQAGAFRAYSLRRTMPIPQEAEDMVFHVLRLMALAYCSGQLTDLRRWLRDHERDIKTPSIADVSWDRRIIYQLYDCWMRLLRKQGWDDLDAICEIIADLRKDQKQYENTAFTSQDYSVKQATAFRLIALYHWAKATELLAVYMLLHGQPLAIEAELDKHFVAGLKAAMAVQDAALEGILRWLHAMSRKMVAVYPAER
ncbi:MAG: hypothetical protein A2X93_07895 [Deltaproteobacteria bacterium GWC2_56_8]|nr:MAG: hypothetical protein A2X93_07895 [Deltaproteobacteria bacterium GWC2_56_8]